MSEDIQKIAEGLTRAQRKAIKGATFHEHDQKWRCHGVMFPADRNLRAKGLVNGFMLLLTPLGEQVRAYLQGERS